jgi:hypothetical protein
MDDVLVTLVGVTLVAFVALVVPALLQIRGSAPFAVAALVVAAGDVVFVSIFLSPSHLVTRLGMLIGHAVIAALVAVGWQLRGRPRPPSPTTDLVTPIRASAPTAFLVVAAGVALLFQFYISMRVAPSNWDSMTYHLSRAAYWLQKSSFGHYPGASVRQLGSGPNAEILQAWTMLITGTDRWVELVQWTALVGLALTIYSGARLLHFGPAPSAFAGALFVVLPMPILQSTTTQNDLVVSFFIAAAALFTARGIRDRHIGDLAVAGAATGLAIGTKGTALIAGPSLLVIALVALWAYRPGWRVVGAGLACAVIGIAAFGAFNYVLNQRNTGDVFGGVKEQVVGAGSDRLQNGFHDLWTFADATGIDASWIEQLGRRPANWVFGGIAGKGYPFTVDTGVQEDTSAFGLVGFLVLPLVLLAVLLWPRIGRGAKTLALASLLYFGLFAYNIAENPWLGRLLLPGVALAAPLFAILARRAWIAGAVAAIAFASLVPSLVHNFNKPVLGPPNAVTVLGKDRITQMTTVRPEMAQVIHAVQSRTGPHAALGYVGGEDSWDYPFFGAHRTHKITRMLDPKQATYDEMARKHLAGVVFANIGPPPSSLRAVPIGPNYYWVPARR